MIAFFIIWRVSSLNLEDKMKPIHINLLDSIMSLRMMLWTSGLLLYHVDLSTQPIDIIILYWSFKLLHNHADLSGMPYLSSNMLISCLHLCQNISLNYIDPKTFFCLYSYTNPSLHKYDVLTSIITYCTYFYNGFRLQPLS